MRLELNLPRKSVGGTVFTTHYNTLYIIFEKGGGHRGVVK